MKAAVIGGGIAGLAAAWQLTSTSPAADVTVFEPDRLGGKILTAPFAGRPIDAGADAFIARVPDALAVCRELGIEGELVAPAAGRALVWAGGRLRPLPEGLILGVPGRIGSLVTSRLLSPLGAARGLLDLVLPTTRWPADMAVAEVVGRRFGREVAERLVDPLLGGIHAGRTERLSAEATAPQLAKTARSSRSLLLGLRRSASPAPGPMFLAPAQGMGRLVDQLVAALTERGVTFSNDKVTALTEQRRGRHGRIGLEPGGTFDGAVIATPAAAAAALIAGTSPEAARALNTIATASVVLVTMAYPTGGLALPDAASGFLVPMREGRLMTACSFGSLKWPHWSSPETMVLRVSAGRDGDDRAMGLDDETLVDRLQDEVALATSATAAPVEWRVNRWPEAFPQYEVGHLDLVARIEAELQRTLPTVALAGASYRGSGIPACIASGRLAASSVSRAAQAVTPR